MHYSVLTETCLRKQLTLYLNDLDVLYKLEEIEQSINLYMNTNILSK